MTNTTPVMTKEEAIVFTIITNSEDVKAPEENKQLAKEANHAAFGLPKEIDNILEVVAAAMEMDKVGMNYYKELEKKAKAIVAQSEDM